jgi:hypothetical protein
VEEAMDKKIIGTFCLFVSVVFVLNILVAGGISYIVRGTAATEFTWVVNLWSASAVILYAFKQSGAVEFLPVILAAIGLAIMADQWVTWGHFWDVYQVAHHEYVASIFWAFALGIYLGVKRSEKK